MRAIFELVKTVFSDWSEDRAPRLGAALAYYAVFSLAPLLVLLIGIAGLVFGQEAVESRVMAQVGGLVGDEGGTAISEMIRSARKPSTGIIATAIGLVTLLFGASGVFGQLHDALNTIWEVGAPGPFRTQAAGGVRQTGSAFFVPAVEQWRIYRKAAGLRSSTPESVLHNRARFSCAQRA